MHSQGIAEVNAHTVGVMLAVANWGAVLPDTDKAVVPWRAHLMTFRIYDVGLAGPTSVGRNNK